MKKIITMVVAALAALTVSAQGTLDNVGGTQQSESKLSLPSLAQHFKTYEGNGFTMHVYNSNDAMGDASYIVETKDGLVTLEEPLFKSGVKEFNDYVAKLGKPITARIVDYHEGGTGSNPIVQPEGMPKFMHEGAYDAMMKGFQKSFGDKMVDLPTGKPEEVKFGDTKTINGVSYQFFHGSANDFPAAGILIGKTFYLSHWAPQSLT